MADADVERVMGIERRLAQGRGTDYAEVLHDDALVVVPGAVLDKPGCVAAMDESPGWDEADLGTPRHVRTQDTVTVVYPFRGRRGDERYAATLASTYVRDGDRWRLLVHQHTVG